MILYQNAISRALKPKRRMVPVNKCTNRTNSFFCFFYIVDTSDTGNGNKKHGYLYLDALANIKFFLYQYSNLIRVNRKITGT
jgi:hypothetical protein